MSTGISDLSRATLSDLLAEQDAAAMAMANAKARQANVAQELQGRYAESAKQALEQAGKSHGAISLPLQDGFGIKADSKQTVTWDSDALQAVAATLPWERVVALFKIKFSMSETIYKGVAALSPELRAKIDAARTTKIAPPAIVLTKEG